MDDPIYDAEWEIPQYLRNIYSLWSVLGDALTTIHTAHLGIHGTIEGSYDPETEDEIPPDTLMQALADREIDVDGETATVHEVIVAASNAIRIAAAAVIEYLAEGDMLPPWWDEVAGALYEEDDDGEE